MEKSEMIFKSVNNRAPYIVDEDSKCLRQIHLTEVVYDFKNGTTQLTWYEAETGDFVHGDLSDKVVYANEDLFKKGELLKPSDLYVNKTIYEIIRSENWRRNVKCEGVRDYLWVYQNGVCAKFYLDDEIGKITKTWGTDGTGQCKIETDIEIPESYYSPQECYEFNDYEIVNNDGTKTFHEGLCKRLKLTKEQEVLVDKLQSVINECKEAKIQVSFDLNDYTLTAYNVANVDRVEYDPEVDEETEVAHYLNLREARTISDVYDINTEDNNLQFVVKKSSLKQSK